MICIGIINFDIGSAEMFALLFELLHGL